MRKYGSFSPGLRNGSIPTPATTAFIIGLQHPEIGYPCVETCQCAVSVGEGPLRTDACDECARFWDTCRGAHRSARMRTFGEGSEALARSMSAFAPGSPESGPSAFDVVDGSPPPGGSDCRL